MLVYIVYVCMCVLFKLFELCMPAICVCVRACDLSVAVLRNIFGLFVKEISHCVSARAGLISIN